jgi:hypothetical protein
VVAAIVGRDEEVNALEAYLDRTIARPVALVLEGEAGIGTSTLSRAAVEEASAEVHARTRRASGGGAW